MTYSPRARMIAIALTASLLPTLGACAAGFETEVDEVKAQNAAADLGPILARDIVVVKAPQAPSAAMAGTLINRGQKDDTLQTVTFTDDAPGSQPLTISPNLTLPAGQVVPLGVGNQAPIAIPDAHLLTLGHFVETVLHFAQAGDMRMQVMVAERAFYFSSIGPAAVATAPATQADTASRATVTGTKIVTDKPATGSAAKTDPAKPTGEAAKPGKAATAKPTTTQAPAAKAATPAPTAKSTAPNAATKPAAAVKPDVKPAVAEKPAAAPVITKSDPAGPRPQ